MHGLMFFHHKHGSGAERSPSAHFLCYNVVKKKEEEKVQVEEYMGMPLCSKTSRQTADWAKTV